MRETILIGHIGNTATVKVFTPENAVINFSVADTERYNDKNGVKQEKTTWIDCQWFMKEASATKMAAHLTKGKKMFVKGKSDARAYIPQGKTEPVGINVLTVTSVEFLDKKEQGAEPAQQSAPAQQIPAGTVNDDDLPF